MTGLGHSYRKIGAHNESLVNYHSAINYLRTLMMMKPFVKRQQGLPLYTKHQVKTIRPVIMPIFPFPLAKKDGFLSSEYEAAEFLTSYYKKIKNMDSAFAYAEYSQLLNDSLNSKAKIRELQILSSNEQFRQRELEEDRQIAAKRRHQQLQLLLIGIFIPVFSSSPWCLAVRKFISG